jgi:antitoxin VapB
MADADQPRTLNLKQPEVYRLARELAATTGESMTEAVRRSLEERLERVRVSREGEVERRAGRLLELGALLRERAPEGWFDQDLDALLYDDAGLPR